MYAQSIERQEGPRCPVDSASSQFRYCTHTWWSSMCLLEQGFQLLIQKVHVVHKPTFLHERPRLVLRHRRSRLGTTAAWRRSVVTVAGFIVVILVVADALVIRLGIAVRTISALASRRRLGHCFHRACTNETETACLCMSCWGCGRAHAQLPSVLGGGFFSSEVR